MRHNGKTVVELQQTIQTVLANPTVSHNHDLHMIVLRAQVALEGGDWQWLHGAFRHELRMYPYDHDDEIPTCLSNLACDVQNYCQHCQTTINVIWVFRDVLRH